MKALITTTINVPHVLTKYRAGMEDDDVVIVAGDMKSPHAEIEALLRSLPGDNRYLSPEAQLNRWKVSKEIGWNCIQRRNIALLEALTTQAETITTVDDDNIPFPDYFTDVAHHLAPDTVHAVFKNTVGWHNPGGHCIPRVVHRGYPYSRRHSDDPGTTLLDARPVKVGVVAGLWYGDPDIDATERMVNAPNVREMDSYAHNGFALETGTWAPFNTQNTTFVRELAPAMFCFPHVGRFDDIWASYVTRRVMDHLGYYAAYGKPFVFQDRNPHDLVKDLEAEILGYRHTDQFTQCLRNLTFETDFDVLSAVDECYWGISDLDFISPAVKKAMDAWMTDIRRVMM